MRDLLLPVAIAITMAFLVQGAVAKPYEIPSGSMEPTIWTGDRVIANRFISAVRDVRRGDIIVFNPTRSARSTCTPLTPDDRTPYVKRVIGLPGDHVVVEAGRREVMVNGAPFDVPRARLNPPQGIGHDRASRGFDVPPGSFFVLGDNRPESCDSHEWTDPFVPQDAILGQVEAVYWPPKHAAFLR